MSVRMPVRLNRGVTPSPSYRQERDLARNSHVRHTGRGSRRAILPDALRVNANPLQTDLCRYPGDRNVTRKLPVRSRLLATLHQSSQGFTLIELMVVLMVLAITSTILIKSSVGLQDQSRYTQTLDRIAQIKSAIINVQTVNGVPQVSGFVADMGRPPYNLHELLENQYCPENIADYTSTLCTGGVEPFVALTPQSTMKICQDGTNPYTDSASYCNGGSSYTYTTATLGAGWNGPYIQTSRNPHEVDGSTLDPVNSSVSGADALTDGWGNEWPYHSDNGYVYSTTTPAWLYFNGYSSSYYDTRHNYGWAYTMSAGGFVGLFSYGSGCIMNSAWCANQGYPSTAYEFGYPTTYTTGTTDYSGFSALDSASPQTLLKPQDWQVSLSNGISVTLTPQPSCRVPASNTACLMLGGTWNSGSNTCDVVTATTSLPSITASGFCNSNMNATYTSGTASAVFPCSDPVAETLASSACAWLNSGTNVWNATSYNINAWTLGSCGVSAGITPGTAQTVCNNAGGSWASPNCSALTSGLSIPLPYYVPPAECSALQQNTGGIEFCLNIYYINPLKDSATDLLDIASSSYTLAALASGQLQTLLFSNFYNISGTSVTNLPAGKLAYSVHAGPCSSTTGGGTAAPTYPIAGRPPVVITLLPGQPPTLVW
jgi:prepilin-type N-terminal cleavage/methylation domain-containing protein